MNLTPVKSSLIVAVAHNPADNELLVRFHGTGDKQEGPLYRYANVTAEQFAEMMAAKSIGGYYCKMIRGNADHPAVKVEETK